MTDQTKSECFALSKELTVDENKKLECKEIVHGIILDLVRYFEKHDHEIGS